MKNNKKYFSVILKTIAQDRERTNILRNGEQKLIAYLVQRVPKWINSDGLTAIGFFGNLFVGICFVLAVYVNDVFLLVSLLGFLVNWYGDSLDGRLAYYRITPRKWYGFSLDVTVDWVGLSIIGLGYFIYADLQWKWLGYVFVVLYGWEMITAQLRYNVTGKYSIDSGIFGPTELRVVLMAIISAEYFFNGSIYYSVSLACLILVVTNLTDTVKVLKAADKRDSKEKQEKAEKLLLENKMQNNA
ncbi:MAG: CDP-alcohol phosphatidyltransferase [Candidatus Saccharimonadaceae bacterium]